MALAVLAAVAFARDRAVAQSDADAYKGKTINLIIAAGEGGGFDIAARLAARHLGQFLPGRPSIVPQNMPGANGLRAAEYLFRVASRRATASRSACCSRSWCSTRCSIPRRATSRRSSPGSGG
jgi:tripartite-type tricarboxylate transporter receptor subunit TctC